MSWMVLGDWLFLAGALAAAGLLLYGGWLCIEEVDERRRPAVAPEPAALRERPVAAKKQPVEEEAQERSVAAIAAMSLLIPSFLLLAGASGAAMAGDSLERGLEAYEQSHYAEAVKYFRIAAETGNGRAQEILGFMYLHGPSLYGASVSMDRAQAAHWFARAAQGGREVSQHMLCVLEGRPAATVVGRASCRVSSTALGAPGPDGMARAAAGAAASRPGKP